MSSLFNTGCETAGEIGLTTACWTGFLDCARPTGADKPTGRDTGFITSTGADGGKIVARIDCCSALSTLRGALDGAFYIIKSIIHKYTNALTFKVVAFGLLRKCGGTYAVDFGATTTGAVTIVPSSSFSFFFGL